MFLGASAIIIITLNQRVLRKVGYGNTHDNQFYKAPIPTPETWVQLFIAAISGIVWVVISNSYDWSMVLKAAINQSRVMLVHPNDLRSHYTESL